VAKNWIDAAPAAVLGARRSPSGGAFASSITSMIPRPGTYISVRPSA
jgi:hypothetical protein